MSYCEHEITQRDFDELMFYIRMKKEEHNTLVKLNALLGEYKCRYYYKYYDGVSDIQRKCGEYSCLDLSKLP